VIALALAGCNPNLKGECKVLDDCPTGTVCQDGLCIAPGAGTADGGGGTCAAACGADTHCESGTCVDDFPPSVAIVTPARGQLVGPTRLQVVVEARAAGGVREVDVRLSGGPGQPLEDECAPTGAANTFSSTLDLRNPGVGTGNWVLTPSLRRVDGSLVTGEQVPIVVDKTGPAVVYEVVRYPERCGGAASCPEDVARGRFRRDEQVTLTVRVTDEPAGLAAEPPVLTTPGTAAVQGEAHGADVFRFRFPGGAPTFELADGSVGVDVTARDKVGNSSTVHGSFLLTRYRWIWTKPNASPVSAAPAIQGANLYVGDTANLVHAVVRATGYDAWSQPQNVESPVVGHVTAGARYVYVLTRAGYAVALDPAAATSATRQAWRCPRVNPNLKFFSAGASLATLPDSAGNPEETLFALTDDGHLRMLRNTPVYAGFCVWDSGYNGTNSGGVPVLVPDPQAHWIACFGDSEGYLHKFRVKGGVGDFSLEAVAGFDNFTRQGGMHGPLALFQNGTEERLLAGTADGAMRVFTRDGALVNAFSNGWSGSELLAQPVTGTDAGGAFAWAVSTRGKAQRLRLPGLDRRDLDFQFNGSLRRSPDARATPVVGADGTTYLAVGARLAALGTDASPRWTLELPPAGGNERSVDLVTPALACDGTLYVVANTTIGAEIHALATDSSGLAAQGWPRGGHDNRNTGNFLAPLPAPGACSD